MVTESPKMTLLNSVRLICYIKGSRLELSTSHRLLCDKPRADNVIGQTPVIAVRYKKLSCCRDRATLRVIKYFAKSLKITQSHSK